MKAAHYLPFLLLLGFCTTTGPVAQPNFQTSNSVLAERIDYTPDKSPAKNLILFIGDGMGISTVTAARIFEGQEMGLAGEEHQLSWETFPHTALSKTYNTDQQIPDSAGTATAMYTGVKTRAGMLGVGPDVELGDCAASRASELETFWDAADASGMRLGLISTTRITDATPAAAYAHASDRHREYDGDLTESDRDGGCRDIATQFVDGNMIDVALGGGRRSFLRDTDPEPDLPGRMGRRMDGVSLIEAWKAKNPRARLFSRALSSRRSIRAMGIASWVSSTAATWISPGARPVRIGNLPWRP